MCKFYMRYQKFKKAGPPIIASFTYRFVGFLYSLKVTQNLT